MKFLFKILDNRLSSKAYFFIGVLTIGLILLLNVNTFYWADDFLIMSDLKSHGILGYCLSGYLNWDGRLISLSAFAQAFFLKYLPVNCITLIWNLLFFWACYNFFQVIKLELKLKIYSKNQEWALIFGMSTLLWISSYKYISETVYWATGGVYTFNLWLASQWLLLYFKIDLKQRKLFFKVVFALFSLIVGASTQNLTIALITLVLINLILARIRKEKTAYHFVLLLFLSLGMLILFVAPGNLVRLKVGGQSNISFNLIQLLINYVSVLKKYLLTAIVLIISAPVALSVLVPYSSFKNQFKIRFNGDLIAVFLENSKWLLLALSTLTTFIVTPGFSAVRTSVYFVFFLFVFIVVTLFRMCSLQVISPNRVLVSKILFSVFYCFLIGVVWFNLIQGFSLKKQIEYRYDVLAKSKDKIVKLPRIQQNQMLFCYKFTDFPLSSQSDKNWVFDNYKAYFGTKEILISK